MGRMKEVFIKDLERKEFEAEMRSVDERIFRILNSKEKQGETAHKTKNDGRFSDDQR
jgi:hypothetical protein